MIKFRLALASYVFFKDKIGLFFHPRERYACILIDKDHDRFRIFDAI